MSPSTSLSPGETRNYAEELNTFLAELAQQPDREPIVSELQGKAQP